MKTQISKIIFLCAPVLFASCGQPPSAGSQQGPQQYPVSIVREAPANLSLQYPANLEGQQNIEIRPKIDGYIERIMVDEGSVVKKGQLLFTINAPQYEQEVKTAQAAVESAVSELSNAEIQVSNLEPLVKKEIITPTALQSAELNLKSKRAVLAQAKAALANARTNVAYTKIVSPVNGVVGTIPNKVGSLVSPMAAQALTTVSSIGKIYAYFSLDEKEFLAFMSKYKGKTIEDKLKQLPKVKLILSDGSKYTEAGLVEAVNGIIDKTTGSVSFRAIFPNPGQVIRSGGSATIEIPLNLSAALLLPQKATFELQGKKMVYIVDNKGMVKAHEIQIMNLNSGNDFVVESGLKAGDKIVTEGMGNLKDSVVIKPVFSQSSKY